MIVIIEGSEKKFGIAIERFKNIPFTFAMEDVPAELADRMLSKFGSKKDGETICDWSCRGPTLLLRAAAWNPTAKLYARVHSDDLRTKFIVEKELGSRVNIIYGEEMHFDKIIMNPPYDGSLHLKILSEAIKHGTEIVNLSPIRWLQDPLAEYKKNSDQIKYKNIIDKLSSLEEIRAIEAEYFLNIGLPFNLGIYFIRNGGWNNNFKNNILSKMINKCLSSSLKNHIVFDDMNGVCCLISLFTGGRGGGLEAETPFMLQKKKAYFTDKINDETGKTYLEQRTETAWGECKT